MECKEITLSATSFYLLLQIRIPPEMKQIRGWIEEAGFKGYSEVEVFSDKYWAMNQLDYLERIKYAYLNHT